MYINVHIFIVGILLVTMYKARHVDKGANISEQFCMNEQ